MKMITELIKLYLYLVKLQFIVVMKNCSFCILLPIFNIFYVYVYVCMYTYMFICVCLIFFFSVLNTFFPFYLFIYLFIYPSFFFSFFKIFCFTPIFYCLFDNSQLGLLRSIPSISILHFMYIVLLFIIFIVIITITIILLLFLLLLLSQDTVKLYWKLLLKSSHNQQLQISRTFLNIQAVPSKTVF